MLRVVRTRIRAGRCGEHVGTRSEQRTCTKWRSEISRIHSVENHNNQVPRPSHRTILWNGKVTNTSALLSLSWRASVYKFASKEPLKLGYHGLKEFRLRYGIIFWRFSASIHFNGIIVLQKRALRVVWRLGPQERCFMSVKFPRWLIINFSPSYFVSKNRKIDPCSSQENCWCFTQVQIDIN